MPVIVNGVLLTSKPKKNPGRESYNDSIVQLIPAIEEARKNGHHKIESIAQYLNENGYCTPRGGRFRYTTMHLILRRAQELGLTKGPRSLSQAASARPNALRISTTPRGGSMTRAAKI
jgi:hypothetical protein